MELFHGDIIFSETGTAFTVWENSYIAIDKGTVNGIYRSIPDDLSSVPLADYGRSLIIPAFSDMHVHAPQYAQRGTSMDLLLSDWLNEVTFPEESRFSDMEYAETVYNAFADDLIRNGTFHVSVFATVHTPSALLLAEILESRGISGFVGKVNMDINSPDYLCESTEASLRDTEDFLSSLPSSGNIRPILTPRFAPTCSGELLSGLGKLSSKYGCGMQTHLVESIWESAEAVRLFPECSCDAGIYEKAGLLDNGPCIFAHFIFPTDDDIRIADRYKALTVHCPDATNNIIAGIMPAGALSDLGTRIALGTDIGAGSRASVYSQAAAAVRLSKLKAFYEPEVSRSVSFSEAFYFATRGAGSVFGNCGSFDKGMDFDALVISGIEDEGLPLSPERRLERFCYNGDDRNITARYIRGKKL